MNYLKKKQKSKKILLFGGLIFLVLSLLIGALLFSLQFEELWHWYAVIQKQLLDLEQRIAEIEQQWLFALAIIALFAIKSFIPIYPTSTVCFLTGVILPMYFSVPVNVLGFCVLTSIRYFAGKRFGAGGAWKMISKNVRLRRLIKSDGTGNPALLIALFLVPGMPINSISGIYGSFNFGYWRFILLSVIGFMPRLISFTFVGRNVFDPLSPGFLVPIMLLAFFTGISLLSVNGVWTAVEKILADINERKKKNLEKKGNIKNDFIK